MTLVKGVGGWSVEEGGAAGPALSELRRDGHARVSAELFYLNMRCEMLSRSSGIPRPSPQTDAPAYPLTHNRSWARGEAPTGLSGIARGAAWWIECYNSGRSRTIRWIGAVDHAAAEWRTR